MGKRGFTLIELLGVIALLSIITVLAVTSVGGITKNIKRNLLEEKAKVIEESGILFGEDIKGSIINSELTYDNNPCKSFLVSTLVPEYLNKDNDNNCLKEYDTSEKGCIVDPSNEDNYLDQYELIIYYKNKRIKAKLDIDNKLSCR